VLQLLLLAAVGLWAGAQNALAGGGSFLTYPVLLFAGLDPRAANITSTVALFPSQIAIAWSGWRSAEGVGPLTLKALVAISLAGGVVGALLLLATPVSFFARLLPWLMLFATVVFAFGQRIRQHLPTGRHLPLTVLGAIQAAIAAYGGYFGAGIGFLMVAALTLAGQGVRVAATTKNMLAAVMNAAAVVVFAFSGEARWPFVLALAVGSVAGGLAGGWLLLRIPERLLRFGIIGLGAALTIWLFLR
jgi:uncharacterized membrane protein YfcA